jgi:hypothetical protein
VYSVTLGVQLPLRDMFEGLWRASATAMWLRLIGLLPLG